MTGELNKRMFVFTVSPASATPKPSVLSGLSVVAVTSSAALRAARRCRAGGDLLVMRQLVETGVSCVYTDSTPSSLPLSEFRPVHCRAGLG